MCYRCSYGNETTDKCGCVADPKCFIFTFILGFAMLVSGIVLLATVPAHVCPEGYYSKTCYVYTQGIDANGLPYTRRDSLRCTSETLPITCKNKYWPDEDARNHNIGGWLLVFGCAAPFILAGILLCLNHGFYERQQIRMGEANATYMIDANQIRSELVLTSPTVQTYTPGSFGNPSPRNYEIVDAV